MKNEFHLVLFPNQKLFFECLQAIYANCLLLILLLSLAIEFVMNKLVLVRRIMIDDVDF
jgi:hypothetical protein